MRTALKLAQVVGVLTLLVGVVMMTALNPYGAFAFIAGALMYAIGRVGVWLATPSA